MIRVQKNVVSQNKSKKKQTPRILLMSGKKKRAYEMYVLRLN